MTERLYYTDSYMREFHGARGGTLRRTGAPSTWTARSFIPLRAGSRSTPAPSPGWRWSKWWMRSERIAHRLAAPLAAEGEVECEIDWARRFDHMQQHTGQHLLSAVFEELFGLRTISFHLGAESATIDLEGGPVEARMVVEAEARANQVVAENRAVDVRL